jgi:hypothetical protein
MREMRYGTIKVWRYGKEDELQSKCSVYVTVNTPPKISECDPELSSESKELIEGTMVDTNGNVLNSGATYDPGGGPEGGYKWQIEQSSEEKILATLIDKRWDYRTDFEDCFFCEVKGLRDRIRAVQKKRFRELEKLTGKDIYLIKFKKKGA